MGKASELSPTPSLSASAVSLLSFGKASELSPTPSLSVSAVSLASLGKASFASDTPSLSLSTGACPGILESRYAVTSTDDVRDAPEPITSLISESFLMPNRYLRSKRPSVKASTSVFPSMSDITDIIAMRVSTSEADITELGEIAPAVKDSSRSPKL